MAGVQPALPDAIKRHRSRSMGEMAAIPPSNMLLGVPKKGRLFEKCSKLLQEGVGLDYRKSERVDVAHCTNMPVRQTHHFRFSPGGGVVTVVSFSALSLSPGPRTLVFMLGVMTGDPCRCVSAGITGHLGLPSRT